MHYNRWRYNGDPNVGKDLRSFSFAERFWMRVAVGEPDVCWPWQSHRNKAGYGRAGNGQRGRTTVAHRIAYALTFGELPDDQLVCHRCDNPPCCNPAHLFLGSHQENADDRERKGRNNIRPAVEARVQKQRDRTTCVNGHPFDEINTYWHDGKRSCRTCRREAVRRSSARKREANASE